MLLHLGHGMMKTPFCVWTVLAGGLTHHFWSNAQRLVAVWPNRLLTLLSAAATLFLLYNILAGGNPPKEDAAVTVEESLSPQKAY